MQRLVGASFSSSGCGMSCRIRRRTRSKQQPTAEKRHLVHSNVFSSLFGDEQIVKSFDAQATMISLPQQDIVRILVNEVASSLGKPASCGETLSKETLERLEQILDVAVCYAAALESRSLLHRGTSSLLSPRQGRPCVELTCFIIAMFFRVRQISSAEFILRSYAATTMNDRTRDVRLAQVVASMATTTTPTTSFQWKSHQTINLTSESIANHLLDASDQLLSAARNWTKDVSLVCHIIGRLLQHRKLLHAMDICIELLLSSSDFPVTDEEFSPGKNKPSLETPT